ncbi:hypothetical protein C1S82_02090 [Mycolicibacterium cosmeticum]|uniref:Uncharacterized protein n=1 Tax=Mycolicibacterium cosmeticum TaxID=258533 RepID=W9B5P8_MYCCO|nr:hypothetical protein [Mycolicibacterium cosmeticum]TLH81520.1 hypothetical protein C1S82_02090 [Mycolicibacterium cosmeticum]CDO10352.1 hypothetical protein BN977_05184 [Mycolicibacterium cosmeticum]
MSGKSPECPVTAKRRFKIALAGYLVTLAFGAVYVAARVLAPSHDHTVAIGAAVVMSLPLAIAFVGDQIRSFRGFGIEVEIKAVSVSLPDITAFGSGDITDVVMVNYSEVNPSAIDTGQSRGIPEQIANVITSPGCEIIQIELHTGSYWWSTRLYLLSALLAHYTEVKRVVFVHSQSRYAGMAEPSALVQEIERIFPALAVAYQNAYRQAVAQPSPRDRSEEASDIAFAWPAAVSALNIDEISAPRVTREWLERTLPAAWRWSAIDGTAEPDGPLLYYRIATSPETYTALLAEDQLVRVVGKHRLTASIATEYLRRRLEG